MKDDCPMEQIDYGVNHRAFGSSSNSVSVEGGPSMVLSVCAFALSLMAFCIVVMLYIDRPQHDALIEKIIAARVMAATEPSNQRYQLGERRIAIIDDNNQTIIKELHKRGIDIPVN